MRPPCLCWEGGIICSPIEAVIDLAQLHLIAVVVGVKFVVIVAVFRLRLAAIATSPHTHVIEVLFHY